MPAAARVAACDCPTCAPPASPIVARIETSLLVVGFALIPGRAILHIIWGALH